VNGYRSASREHPCPVCAHDSWCSTAGDGVVFCRRVESDCARLDKNGDPFWVHYPHGVRPAKQRDLPPVPIRASADDLNAVYGMTLDRLPLKGGHRENLRERGVSDPMFEKLGYRTLIYSGRDGLMRPIVDRFGEALLRTVPGYGLSQGRHWLYGASGMVFPIRDLAGRIIALSVRTSRDGDGKYCWISSAKYKGPGPGSPIHVPLFEGDRRTVRVCEGALKADVASALGGVLTLGLAGLYGFDALIAILREIGPEEVWLAYDGDASENRHVSEARTRAWKRLTAEGFDVQLEAWGWK
jgi:hypothetical protein